MPVRWIEQREARQVLMTALFERTPESPWSSAAGDLAAQILPGLRSWLAARHLNDEVVAQARPGVQPAGRRDLATRCRGDDEGYFSTW
jgi:hypothetical protein